MNLDLKVNQLPARTWNHLGMNEAVLKNIRIDTEGRFVATIPEGVCVDAERGCCAKEPDIAMADNPHKNAGSLSRHDNMEEELDRLLAAQKIPVHRLLIPAGEKIAEPARFRFSYQDGGHVFDRISITALEDSELTVVMDFSSPAGSTMSGAALGAADVSSTAHGAADSSLTADGTAISAVDSSSAVDGAAPAPADSPSAPDAKKELSPPPAESFAGIRTKIRAGKNSLLRLVQIQRLGESFTFFNDIDSFCEEGARLELVQLVFGGGNTFQGCTVQLAGRESSFGADIGYLVQGSQRLDMNYAAFHQGKQSKSEINAHGVLKDHAFKLFRGTIDFQTGAAGSEGEEKEDVLLLDDGVVNQTIPLILCAEEDVQGNHGATIGNLDEELLFYLESRGISKKEIYEMMARARLETVCQKIPDGEARALAQSCLTGTAKRLQEGEYCDEH